MSITSNKILFFVHSGIFSLLCLLTLVSFFAPSSLLAFVGAFIYLVIVYMFYRKSMDFFILFLFLLYGQLTGTLSNVYIELGGLILEQFRFGYATGATVRLVLYNYIFFVFALFVYEKLKQFWHEDNKVSSLLPHAAIRTVYLTAITMFIFLFVGLIIFGSPLLMHIDRFAYWQNHPFLVLDSVRYKMNILALLLGMISVHKKQIGQPSEIPLVFLLIIFIINALYGDKFSGIVICSYLYFIPVGLDSYYRTGFLGITRRAVFGGLLFCVVILGLVSYHYRTIAADANIEVTESIADLIVARALGLQGHVWWGIDESASRVALGRASRPQLKQSIEVLLGSDSKHTFTGLHALMYDVSPASLVNNYIEKGIRFTLGNPAIGLYTLGYIGLIFYQLMTAVLFSIFICYFRRQIMGGNLLRAAVCLLILLGLYEAFLMGNLSFLFTPYLLKYLVLLVIIEILVSTTCCLKRN